MDLLSAHLIFVREDLTTTPFIYCLVDSLTLMIMLPTALACGPMQLFASPFTYGPVVC